MLLKSLAVADLEISLVRHAEPRSAGLVITTDRKEGERESEQKHRGDTVISLDDVSGSPLGVMKRGWTVLFTLAHCSERPAHIKLL